MSAVSAECSTLLALGHPCVALGHPCVDSVGSSLSHNSLAIMEDAASQQANKALCFTFSLRLADIVSNHNMKRLIDTLSVSLDLDVHTLPVAPDGLKVLNSLWGWSWTSLDSPSTAGRGFEVTQGLVGQRGRSTRYSLGPNTLLGMQGCPGHLSMSGYISLCSIVIILTILS